MENLPSSKIILFSLFAGLIAGIIFDQSNAIFGINIYNFFNLMGSIFLNSLKMIVVPLIMSSLIYNISSFSNIKDFSNLGTKTIIFYVFTSLVAIIIGITVVNIIQPGILNGNNAANLIGLDVNSNISLINNLSHDYSLSNFLLNIFSGNIFISIAHGNMLFIIFFSIIFGLAMRSSSSKSVILLKSFWEGMYIVFLKITKYILFFTPYGVFCLVAKATMTFDPDSYIVLLNFFITVILGLLIHSFIFYPIVLYFFKANAISHFKGMFPALLMAFSSSSSVATIPITSKCLVDNLGHKNNHVNFIIPLGSTINMDGTALFECVAVIFIAQSYGLDLALADQFLILSLALITSIGVAGIPSASFVAIIVILSAVGLPFEAVGIILGVDRILDMLRTSVNVLGDSCCVRVVTH
ncbi:MAG: dicarboxylate/amino acid:cation symporter [Gammaproteobacteria bacterium]|jgi:proton glutamate symport protein|nr:dicarboxylate/amino acid:cation symporter [Gammaproteobacteria bacterium]MBT7603238.1 dicarboxylate/amino acid:cation symporter [Gammaproteobacteria bacterium]